VTTDSTDHTDGERIASHFPIRVIGVTRGCFLFFACQSRLALRQFVCGNLPICLIHVPKEFFMVRFDKVRASVALLLMLCLLHTVPAQEKEPKQPTAEEALKRLKEGNDRFVADKLAEKNLGKNRRAELAKGQAPFAIILGCADSRVTPELLFDQGLGELFVVRVAGNVTDPSILGSIEYAVEHLHSPLIVVIGHESCGAVKAALSGDKLEGNLAQLIKKVRIGEDLPTDKSAKLEAAIKNNAKYHATRLRKESPLINDFAATGRVRIVAATYSLKTGAVEWLETKKK
jgi:carbonic anhydrase